MENKARDELCRKIKVMAAYLAGETIESRIPPGQWADTENPEWDWLHVEYRVKEPKKVIGWISGEELTLDGKFIPTPRYGKPGPKVWEACDGEDEKTLRDHYYDQFGHYPEDDGNETIAERKERTGK